MITLITCIPAYALSRPTRKIYNTTDITSSSLGDNCCRQRKNCSALGCPNRGDDLNRRRDRTRCRVCDLTFVGFFSHLSRQVCGQIHVRSIHCSPQRRHNRRWSDSTCFACNVRYRNGRPCRDSNAQGCGKNESGRLTPMS